MRDDRTRLRALESYLVAQAKAGDRAAADRLIRLRGPRLYAHAARLLGDAEAAQDMVQEAWVEILRGLPALREAAAFPAWATRIVTRRVAREIGGRQRRREIAREVTTLAEPATASDGPAQADAAAVRAAIAGLPPAQRATVALFYLDGMTVAEVALATDVPAGTVKTRLMHAREKLRAAMKGDLT